MSFLLDTNAVSEPQKATPNNGYVAWLQSQPLDALFMSVLTLGELKRGVLKLPEGRRRVELDAWINEAVIVFGSRLLIIDAIVASAWAEVTMQHRAAKVTVGAADELIAATALAHGLTVVTRNVKDFRHSGCRFISPWTDLVEH